MIRQNLFYDSLLSSSSILGYRTPYEKRNHLFPYSFGVMLGDHCVMDKQIKHICWTTHFHLLNISSTRDILTKEAATQFVHSLVTLAVAILFSSACQTRRLHHCNESRISQPELFHILSPKITSHVS